MAEMKMGLMYVTVLISAIVFVFIYQRFFKDKSITTALQYGIFFGVGIGISMGYGTYSYMPIPYKMAFTWCFGTIVKSTISGLILGFTIKE